MYPPLNKVNTEFSSGKRYWELKIEKMPADEDDLVVGVSLHSNSKTYQYLWGYQLATGKKVHIQKDSVGVVEEDYEPYGYFLKQNDICGVELSFKATTASIIFYKNGISCGKAFFIDFQALKIDNRQLIPYINIGGECQVTLDSKAALPLTSYRLK
jgi:tripartite motif-containing protein 9/67